MTHKFLIEIVEKILMDLQKAGMLEGDLNFSENLALIGPGSPLDSLAFISFLTQLEDKLSLEKETDVYISLNEIQGFDLSKNHLVVKDLIQHLSSTLN